MNETLNEVALHGEVGPAHVEPLRAKLDRILAQSRPQVEIDLSEVTTMHLGVVNVLIAARDEARARLGDLAVIVRSESDAQRTLARVGIVGTMRP